MTTDMKMGMNKVPVCNRNGYGIELFCFFSISNSAHHGIEIFDSIWIRNRLGVPFLPSSYLWSWARWLNGALSSSKFMLRSSAHDFAQRSSHE